MKIPREETRKSHEHNASYWTWAAESAVWVGHCVICDEDFEATPWEAMRLEHHAEKWAREHPTPTPSFISPSSP
jgi:hypothetical protein